MGDNRPKRVALERAARLIAAAIRRAAPTEKSAASFALNRDGDDFVISSRDIGTVMTETGQRHPVFAKGSRAHWTWVAQNAHHPGRTHFMDRAATRAADKAAQVFADEWVQIFTETTEWSAES